MSKPGIALIAVAATLALPAPAQGKVLKLKPHTRATLVCGTDSSPRVLRVRNRAGRKLNRRVVAYGSGVLWGYGRARVSLDRHAGLVVNRTGRAAVRWRCS